MGMTKVFGGWGRPVPEEMQGKIVATWGARAIYTGQQIDLLPDRQCWYSPTVETDEVNDFGGSVPLARLREWINTKGLPFLRKQAHTLYPDENRTVTFNDGPFHIEANPQASYGYLYIRAWEAVK